MNKTISVSSTELEVNDWREADFNLETAPEYGRSLAAVSDSESDDLKLSEVSFATNVVFPLYTSFGVEGEPYHFQIVDSDNGRYRARSV